MKEMRILGLMITDRIKEAGRTQKVLSKNANIIKSRLGFHEVSEDVCSRVGMVLLQLGGNQNEWEQLENELQTIEGLEIQHMSFQY
jgi:ribosome biogenesis SPOUT family RNA methylase Rps3